jgi:hypothetical protein
MVDVDETGLEVNARMASVIFVCSQTSHSKPVPYRFNGAIFSPSTKGLHGYAFI